MEHVVRSGPNYTRGREPTRLADNNTTGSGITKIEELRGYPAVCNARAACCLTPPSCSKIDGEVF